MTKKRKILVVVEDLARFRQLEDLLRRTTLEVDRAPSGAGGLVLAGNVRYDLVLAAAPLPDLGLEAFLRTLGRLEPNHPGPAVLALVAPAHVETLAGAVDGQLMRFLRDDASGQEIRNAVSEVLGVAARVGSRLLVDMQVEIGGDRRRRMVQSVNVSLSGMLLKASDPPAVGTTVHLEFGLPGGDRTVRCSAEVVRHSDREREGLVGFGVRYLEISQEHLEQLRGFLEVDLGDPVPADRAAPGR